MFQLKFDCSLILLFVFLISVYITAPHKVPPREEEDVENSEGK